MPYKLTDDENYLLDKLDKAGKSKDAQALEAALKMIPDVNGRKYLISKVLNSSEDLARLNGTDAFKNVNKDFWNVSNQENYTPPDVAKIKAEGFYDEESPYHWTKRTPSELQQISENQDYESFNGFMNDVRDEQTKQNREKPFKGVGGTALELLYPRMSEAVKRGEDIDVGDIVGDEAEQFLYSVNPIGRGLEGAFNGAKLGSNAIGKGLKYLASKTPGYLKNLPSNAANPLALETLDAMIYEGKDTPRADFNGADVLLGTGINGGMDWLANKIVLRKLSEKAKNSAAAKDIVGFISNKAGDVVSENPRFTKTVIRSGLRGMGPAGQLINYPIDLYYDSKKAPSRRKELDELLGSQR